ncbi:outer membrane beta-barrel protein [candidate division KSB1 bacterium]|nr:outer membrane beta-barrel protein [candidate division KSB1 bacterium]
MKPVYHLKSVFLKLFIVALAGYVFHSSGFCQTPDYSNFYQPTFMPHLYLGGKLGMSFIGGDVSEVWDYGIGLSGLAGYQLTPNWAIEGEFNIFIHSPNEDKNKIVLNESRLRETQQIEVYQSAAYFGLLMSAKYSINPNFKAAFSPFVAFGAGFQVFMWDITEEAWAMPEMNILSTDGVYATTFSPSIGADFKLTDNLFLMGNVRYNIHLWSDELVESGDEVDFEGNAFVITAGGTLHF